MRRYEKYKDSGIEWVGEIPEHWESIRLKYIGYLYGGLAGKSANDFNQESNFNNKPFIPFTNICNNKIIDPNQLQQVVIEENEQQNQVAKGDLFFMMSSENFDDVGKSSILLEDLGETYLNSFCKGFRFTTDKYYAPFINYQLLSKAYRSLVLTEANGYTRINLKIDKINDIQLKTPPTLDEQITIANYLDKNTAEIDELIKQKEALLLLFEEEKAAIINHAVSKGVKDIVNIKESIGIDWIGEIPENWEVKKLKYLLKISNGEGIRAEECGEIGEYPVYGGNGILGYSSKFNNSDRVFIIGRVGAKCGNVRLVDGDKWVSDNALLAYGKGNLDFLLFAMKNLNLNNLANKNAQPLITSTMIKEQSILYPPNDEQILIVQFINSETARIDLKLENTIKLIEQLKEYKTALISEVATGKVKVI